MKTIYDVTRNTNGDRILRHVNGDIRIFFLRAGRVVPGEIEGSFLPRYLDV